MKIEFYVHLDFTEIISNILDYYCDSFFLPTFNTKLLIIILIIINFFNIFFCEGLFLIIYA